MPEWVTTDLVVYALIVLIVSPFIVINRGRPKEILKGVLSLIPGGSLILGVTSSGKPNDLDGEVHPAVFYYESTKRPVPVFMMSPDYHNSAGIDPPEYYKSSRHQWIQDVIMRSFPQKLADRKDFSDLKRTGDDDPDLWFYTESLLYVFIRDLVEQFGQGWSIYVSKSVGPGGESRQWESSNPKGSNFIEWTEIKNKLEEYLTTIEVPDRIASLSSGFHLPPKTEFSISSTSIERCILFKSRLFELEVIYRPRQWSRGLGRYGPLFDVPSDHDDIRNIQCQISYRAKFNRFAPGHPLMKSCRDWVEKAIELLGELDYERHLEEVRKWRSQR